MENEKEGETEKKERETEMDKARRGTQGKLNGVLKEGEQQAVDIDFLESAES